MSDQVHPNQNPNQNNSEEIDLGQLFKLIGDGFKKLFNFIGNIFKGIFNLIISFLLFIQKHIIKFVVAGVVGVIIGVFLDMNKAPVYVSTMVVEPNFESVQQLYNNINFYNELAEAQDSTALSEALGIDVSDAATIKSFMVESYSDENQKIQLFDEFVRKLDTTTQRAIDMEKFLENFNSYDARFHTIKVEAINSMVARKLHEPIINSISQNTYFKRRKKTQAQNIELQKQILDNQMVEIDSLRMLYKRVMEKEADKPLQGTSISLGDQGANQESKEIELINKVDDIKQELVELNEEEANKSEILNVISDFPRRGVEAKGLFRSYKFLVPIALFGLLLFGLSLIELNKFLKEYSEKNKQ